MKKDKFIITINREYGSGGREIAEKLGALLGVKVYDKTLLARVEEEFGLDEEEVSNAKMKKTSWWSEFSKFYTQFGSLTGIAKDYNDLTPRDIYAIQKKILLSLAAKESCIIVGRAGFHIFKNNPNALKVLLIADFDARVKHVAEKYDISEAAAKRRIKQVDKDREEYTKTYAGVSRYDARNYDFVINVTDIPTYHVAAFLAQNAKMKLLKTL
ncbi:MAG: cytidylate kinase-like family protein [Bacteroidales bacterium]|jgi:cytidylate kinase|nr:cytidylate kinase-like family protein [Bacteroidales bacterium]